MRAGALLNQWAKDPARLLAQVLIQNRLDLHRRQKYVSGRTTALLRRREITSRLRLSNARKADSALGPTAFGEGGVGIKPSGELFVLAGEGVLLELGESS